MIARDSDAGKNAAIVFKLKNGFSRFIIERKIYFHNNLFLYIFELYFNGVLEELDLVKGLLYNSLVTENKLKALLSVNLHVFGTEVHLLCAFKILCIIMCQTDK